VVSAQCVILVIVHSRIMYIEAKNGDHAGEAWIGRVTFSKTGKRVYYGDQSFQRHRYPGIESNHYEITTGDDYWISGAKRTGGDRHHSHPGPVQVDEDVRVEYWTAIRGQPQRASEADANR
jgi:hypothetical protein